MIKKIVFFVLVFCFFSTVIVNASSISHRNRCMALSALAGVQCKSAVEFNFVGQQGEDIFIFNSFYGSKYEDFYCRVKDGVITILSKDRKYKRAVPYFIDQNGCGIVEVDPAGCEAKIKIKCCLSKTLQEKQKDKEYEFWSRPVPELLKRDQIEAQKELERSKSSETKQ